MKFQPGQSGNPAGRKPGSGKVAKLRAHIEKAVPEILDALVAQARNGDAAAAKLLLDRALPILKPEPRTQAAAAPTAPAAILAAAAAGELPLEQAERLMALAVAQAKVAELVEVQDRLERIEIILRAPDGNARALQ